MPFKKLNSAPLSIIILLIALSQISETIYVVSLPQIAINFKTNQTLVEYTLSSYLIGFALGILLWGNLSDKTGRRVGLFWGLGLFISASLLCWLSESIQYLIIARFIQGFGASVGSVLGQAIIRDTIAPKNRTSIFSIISIAMAFAPATGSIIGSIVIQYFHWSMVFIVLIIFATIIVVNIALFMPETNLNLNKNINLFGKCAKQFINDKPGLRLGFLVGAVMGLLFGYFAESAFYFMKILSVSSIHYGMLAFLICIPLAAGSAISKIINHPNQIIYLGIIISLISSICFLILVYFDIISAERRLLSIILSTVCIYLVLGTASMIIPNCLSQILADYGKYAGTAASIFGFYYYIVTAIITVLMAVLHNGTIIKLPLFFVIVSTAMLIVHAIPKDVLAGVHIRSSYYSK